MAFKRESVCSQHTLINTLSNLVKLHHCTTSYFKYPMSGQDSVESATVNAEVNTVTNSLNVKASVDIREVDIKWFKGI